MAGFSLVGLFLNKVVIPFQPIFALFSTHLISFQCSLLTWNKILSVKVINGRMNYCYNVFLERTRIWGRGDIILGFGWVWEKEVKRDEAVVEPKPLGALERRIVLCLGPVADAPPPPITKLRTSLWRRWGGGSLKGKNFSNVRVITLLTLESIHLQLYLTYYNIISQVKLWRGGGLAGYLSEEH